MSDRKAAVVSSAFSHSMLLSVLVMDCSGVLSGEWSSRAPTASVLHSHQLPLAVVTSPALSAARRALKSRKGAVTKFWAEVELVESAHKEVASAGKKGATAVLLRLPEGVQLKKGKSGDGILMRTIHSRIEECVRAAGRRPVHMLIPASGEHGWRAEDCRGLMHTALNVGVTNLVIQMSDETGYDEIHRRMGAATSEIRFLNKMSPRVIVHYAGMLTPSRLAELVARGAWHVVCGNPVETMEQSARFSQSVDDADPADGEA